MSGGTLHQLFEDRVRTAPDRTAVITDRARLSYRGLDERANRLARHLIETAGLPPGGLVAIRTLRTPDVLVAVLGVLKAGGVYGIIGPYAPEPPGLAEARAVISHRVHLGLVEGARDRPVILLDGDAAAIDAHSAEPLPAAGAGAAVLFTAGTTGPRRAVPVTHNRLRAAYDSWSGVFGIEPEDRVLVTAAPDLTGFTAGWIRALCSGAALVLSAGERYTVADTDPETAVSLLDGAGEHPGLRLLAVGGEPLPLDRHVLLERRLTPGARLISVYGPTEAAGCGTWFETGRLRRPVRNPVGRVCLGEPFPGCAVQIRKGRIWLSPPGGGGWVPTGDLGRREGTGPLEFRGRLAHRVRAGGRTVDTFRIESALASHPQVRESAVGEDGGELIAYVVPAPGTAGPGENSVRSHLRGTVPDADLPGRVVPIASLPRNSAGRVDRGALIRPPVRPPGTPGGTRRYSGKGGGSLAPGEAGIGLGAAIALPLALVAFVITDEIWPGSTDLSAVPSPWAGLFRVLYAFECLALGAGLAFLAGGWYPMARRGGPRPLTAAAFAGIGWLLVSWWPQDNLYRLAAKQDWERQAALVYAFNIPLMIAAAVVAVWAVRTGPGPSPGTGGRG
ncbi:AMP-binding protein [Streptomyces sp. CAU 1734]|uniref:AMP-binding protein n=1 Tax=Streptomyces sp. CAU 1734 TaxID=3140360 RepID=UPI003260B926